MTFVRRTTPDGHPLTLWHVTRPMRTAAAGCLTGCGRVVDSPWPTAGIGWTHRQFSDLLPAREERCTANGCRQRWETTAIVPTPAARCKRCGGTPVVAEVEGRTLVCATCRDDAEFRAHAERDYR